jgi:putative ABC transport system permease protein
VIRHLIKLVWKRKRTNGLLMLEIFFSFLVIFDVATFGAAMIIRYRRPLGFDYHDVWLIAVPSSNFMMREKDEMPRRQMFDHMLRELRAMPEIEAATAAGTPPLNPTRWESGCDYNGRHFEATRDSVTDDYDKVMRAPVLQGRWFGPQDDAAAMRPVVIDSDLEREIAPDKKVIGKEVSFDGQKPFKIVGVIAPFRKDGEFSKDHVNMAFNRVPLRRAEGNVPGYLFVRVRRGTSADFEQNVTKRLHAIAPENPVRIAHMESMHQSRMQFYLGPAILGGVIASFLIMMVALGLSGVLWQTVTRRTREIGLRRALGATGGQVHMQILIEVALLSTLAVIIGVVVVAQLPMLGIFRLVSGLAFTIGLIAALATIYALTLLCGLYPSWLAGRVQPAQALHYE